MNANYILINPLTQRKTLFRNTNQDGLENFFGCCKSYCNCGKNPIPLQYRTAYTTVIVNNLVGPISLDANCEDDKAVALLSDIDSLLLDREENIQNEPTIEDDVLETIVFDPIFVEEELTFIENQSVSRAGSVVCAKILQTIGCNECKRVIRFGPNSSLSLSELNENCLARPSKEFQTQFHKIFSAVNQVLPDLCAEKSILKKTVESISSVKISGIGCLEHESELSDKLKKCITNYALIHFCNNVNNIFTGKIFALPLNANVIQEKAYKFVLKHKRIGKYTDIFLDQPDL